MTMPDVRRLRASTVAKTLIQGCLLAALAGCAGSASTPRPAQQPPQQAEIIREDVSFPIEKGVSTVEIDNQYGEINVRDHDEDEVGVHGVIQTLPPDFARARVVSSVNGGVLRLAVELPEGKVGGRYDMAAYLPRSLNLVVNGARDRVDARKRLGPVTARTTSGAINASSHARLDLSTDTGAIKAAVLAERWTGGSRIRSGSGRIIALIPLSGDISLNAETGGRLSTDFGLSVHPRETGGFSASARYGSGASKLEVYSDSGEVILEHAVLLEQDGDSSDEVD
ncbi:hypothetical protein SAMN05216289_104169 [Dokdonella immobilis]|uniref:Adhesin n=1 Tax=Dokdonella immobilis TaxID=578942 RepID=A0A1I4WCS1_9GAMM|nr:hypothetical protein SAMN05216289_104169 [Dokdonella immobilis]